jgi:hypothetical protein
MPTGGGGFSYNNHFPGADMQLAAGDFLRQRAMPPPPRPSIMYRFVK